MRMLAMLRRAIERRGEAAARGWAGRWEAEVREALPDARIVRDGTALRVSGAGLMKSLLEEPRLRFFPEPER